MKPRIRTVKPEFFLHEKLFDLEQESGLPIRLAFEGLWCWADRDGRFEWRPRTLKAGILPFDDVDFSRVLDALESRGFLVKYACGEGQQREVYGWIPTLGDHQAFNNKEKPSELPAPDDCEILTPGCTRDERVNDASLTSLVPERVEGNGKGREGKGEEKRPPPTIPTSREAHTSPPPERIAVLAALDPPAQPLTGAERRAFQAQLDAAADDPDDDDEHEPPVTGTRAAPRWIRLRDVWERVVHRGKSIIPSRDSDVALRAIDARLDDWADGDEPLAYFERLLTAYAAQKRDVGKVPNLSFFAADFAEMAERIRNGHGLPGKRVKSATERRYADLKAELAKVQAAGDKAAEERIGAQLTEVGRLIAQGGAANA